MTHCGLEETFSFNESDKKDILLSLEQAQIHAFRVKKRRLKRGRSSGILLKIRRRASKLPLLSILLANVQSFNNKMDDLRLRLSYQRDIKNCNILCLRCGLNEMWLNEDTDNIELARFSMHQQNRDATSGKMRGGCLSFCLLTAGEQCLILKKSRGISRLR
jgi:hypothetical protein